MNGRRLLILGGAVAAVGVGVAVAATVSPRPGAAVIRALFRRDGERQRQALEPHRPPDVTVVTERYSDDPAALLDVYTPSGASGALPTLVWTHGGGGVGGSRLDAGGYYAALAHEGFTVVAVDYRLAPKHPHPAAVQDVQSALQHLRANAERLHVDSHRVVLAGDSAGAQITSQVATIVTSPAYAELLGMTPALPAAALRGVVLCCGYYDLELFASAAAASPVPALRWGLRTVIASITGSRSGRAEVLEAMSVTRHVTDEFPPAFITGGNADPLTDEHSRPFASTLAGLGVEVHPVFFHADHAPPLGHEYQFDLDSDDAATTLRRMLVFLHSVTA